MVQPGGDALQRQRMSKSQVPCRADAPHHHCEAFPHGPLDPVLAKDIDELLDKTAKDASGPTSLQERTEHLQRYFQQVGYPLSCTYLS